VDRLIAWQRELAVLLRFSPCTALAFQGRKLAELIPCRLLGCDREWLIPQPSCWPRSVRESWCRACISFATGKRVRARVGVRLRVRSRVWSRRRCAGSGRHWDGIRWAREKAHTPRQRVGRAGWRRAAGHGVCAKGGMSPTKPHPLDPHHTLIGYQLALELGALDSPACASRMRDLRGELWPPQDRPTSAHHRHRDSEGWSLTSPVRAEEARHHPVERSCRH